MNVGMMWWDADPKTTLQSKVIRAADYYRHKYGQVPTECYVNPKMLDSSGLQIGILTIRPLRSILPGHLWIGMKETEND